MRFPCKYCTKEVWSDKINGVTRMFEDPDRRIPHIHHGNKKSKSYDDHVLITKTVSRVSELERRTTEILEKIEFIVSELSDKIGRNK